MSEDQKNETAAAGEPDRSHDQGHAENQLKVYTLVFLSLMVLTAATVGAAQLEMGKEVGTIVALAIAALKASLVALYFMHLKSEVKPLYVIPGDRLIWTAVSGATGYDVVRGDLALLPPLGGSVLDCVASQVSATNAVDIGTMPPSNAVW